MKIPAPARPAPSLWPTTKSGVLDVAQAWYDPHRVRVDPDAIAALPQGTITPPDGTNFDRPVGVRTLRESVAYGIALNAINHRFWALERGAFVRYEHNGLVGALAMTDGFQRAWLDPASPIRRAVDAKVPLTADGVRTLFGAIPDPEGRAVILNEVLTHPDFEAIVRTVEEAIVEHGRVGTPEAALLAQTFPAAYGDGVLKKAQLAISACWRAGAAQAQMDGTAAPVCEVTAFADYQIPNVLRALGVLVYAPELAHAIDTRALVPAEGADERALRAASILAVEDLARAQGVAVADVDYWLWLNRKVPTTPFHLTETNAY